MSEGAVQCRRSAASHAAQSSGVRFAMAKGDWHKCAGHGQVARVEFVAQCGRLGGDYTLPLFEFKCVGLGRPWLDSPITENAIRRQWGAIVASIPEEDKLNKQLVAPRLVYD